MLQKKKSLGQHFLRNRAAARAIATAAALEPGDTVVEIGPGSGAVTTELLASGAHVIAVEADARLLPTLERRFAAELAEGQLTLINEDIRQFSPHAHGLSPHRYKLVGNIPYYLSGWLFRTFLTTHTQPATLVFLVQKEVARRATETGNARNSHSLLSLSIALYGTAKYVMTVPRSDFSPPPAVDSAIVAVTDISRTHACAIDETMFFSVLRTAFQQKRKQLLRSLSSQYPAQAVQRALAHAALEPTRRPEQIPLADWLRVTNALAREVNHTP